MVTDGGSLQRLGATSVPAASRRCFYWLSVFPAARLDLAVGTRDLAVAVALAAAEAAFVALRRPRSRRPGPPAGRRGTRPTARSRARRACGARPGLRAGRRRNCPRRARRPASRARRVRSTGRRATGRHSACRRRSRTVPRPFRRSSCQSPAWRSPLLSSATPRPWRLPSLDLADIARAVVGEPLGVLQVRPRGARRHDARLARHRARGPRPLRRRVPARPAPRTAARCGLVDQRLLGRVRRPARVRRAGRVHGRRRRGRRRRGLRRLRRRAAPAAWRRLRDLRPDAARSDQRLQLGPETPLQRPRRPRRSAG